jgi:hypothetical protein
MVEYTVNETLREENARCVKSNIADFFENRAGAHLCWSPSWPATLSWYATFEAIAATVPETSTVATAMYAVKETMLSEFVDDDSSLQLASRLPCCN